jgi:hypothetical protein
MTRQLLETEQKALELNLDESIYGTFAEIGAGQEVARYFFQVGAAAGTIAKTMSAYDKIYSDEIYGPEPKGRYVCESRLNKMLDHEYELLRARLKQERPGTKFFVFADTVAAINYQRTIRGNGWLGLRFQLQPDKEPNELILHVRMFDNDSQLQAQAIGILGVNMIYGCHYYYEDPVEMLRSMMDNLSDRIQIDMIHLTGPDFSEVDNRLLTLKLVQHGLSKVAMFGPDGKGLHPSEFLYRKSVMVVRGSFRPATRVNMDMIATGFAQFREEPEVDSRKTYLLTEITVGNLSAEGPVDDRDFLDRVTLLNALGQTVMVSSLEDHEGLNRYLYEQKVPLLGMVIGVRELLELISKKFYDHQDGSLLGAFGSLFTKGVRIYAYPALQEGSGELMTSENLPVPEGVRFIYRHLVDAGHIVDIAKPDVDHLHIFSKEVFRMIQAGEKGWEPMVPKKVAQLIKDNYLFGYPMEQVEFEY